MNFCELWMGCSNFTAIWRQAESSFRFRLIAADADNKFADCAIAAEADFIITEDRHFDALFGSGYKPQPISPGEFIRRFLREAGAR